jgi:ABC-type sugar transport system ATPase subunit
VRTIGHAIGASNKTRLAHVRWLAGGTGTGKSTLCRILAQRHDLTVYIGDRAELTWVPRFTPEAHPHAWANIAMTVEQRALRAPEQRFAEAASLHGETIDFVVTDLLAMPDDRPILVDWFGNTHTTSCHY